MRKAARKSCHTEDPLSLVDPFVGCPLTTWFHVSANFPAKNFLVTYPATVLFQHAFKPLSSTRHSFSAKNFLVTYLAVVFFQCVSQSPPSAHRSFSGEELFNRLSCHHPFLACFSVTFSCFRYCYFAFPLRFP